MNMSAITTVGACLTAHGTWQCNKTGLRGILRIYYSMNTPIVMKLEDVNRESLGEVQQADVVRIV
jgi:hypothetical protein